MASREYSAADEAEEPFVAFGMRFRGGGAEEGQPFGTGYSRYAYLYSWGPDARLNEWRSCLPALPVSFP